MENRSIDNIVKQSLDDFKVKYDSKDWALMEGTLNAEESTPLDETAKSKLQEMEVPYNAASWLAMESALDNLDLETVDEVAKSALDNFETPYNPTDWSIMGAMLDLEMPVEIPNEFDEMAKTALTAYTVPMAPFDWETMDMQLDEAGFPNEIDAAAKAALHQYESGIPSNWAAMESSLVEAEEVRRQLIITKSIEVFLFVFAIWTIGNFLPFEQKSSDSVIQSIEKVEQSNAIANAANEDNQSQATVENTASFNEASIIETNRTNTFGSNNNNFNNTAITNTDVAIIQNNKQTNVVIKNQSTNDIFQENMKSSPLNVMSGENVIKNIKDNAIEEKATPNNTIKEPLVVVPTTSLDERLVTYKNKKGSKFRKPAKYIDNKTLILAFNEEEVLPKSSVSDKYKYRPLRIKTGGGVQSSAFFKRKDFENRKPAKGLATRLGIDYAISDKVELSSGISYSKESYMYQEQLAFSGYSALHMDHNVEIDIIQVPVRLNYKIAGNEKTRLYGVTGITGGVIMKVDNSSNTSLVNSISNLRSADEALSTNNSMGVLQNGKMSTSTFVTADIGLGLEYQVAHRFSLFIEPLFQRSIKPIGRDKESYQNYGLSVGTRVML